MYPCTQSSSIKVPKMTNLSNDLIGLTLNLCPSLHVAPICKHILRSTQFNIVFRGLPLITYAPRGGG